MTYEGAVKEIMDILGKVSKKDDYDDRARMVAALVAAQLELEKVEYLEMEGKEDTILMIRGKSAQWIKMKIKEMNEKETDEKPLV